MPDYLSRFLMKTNQLCSSCDCADLAQGVLTISYLNEIPLIAPTFKLVGMATRSGLLAAIYYLIKPAGVVC